MKKKLISMLLAVSMTAVLLAGCGNSESAQGQSQEKGQEEETEGAEEAGKDETAKKSETAGEDEGAEGEKEPENDKEDMAEIVVGWMSMTPLDESKTDGVEEAINKMTEEKIHTHVDIQWYDPNTYAQQIPLMIQGNDKLDLIMYTPVPGAGYTSFKSQGQLMEIGDLLKEYAPEIVSMMGNLLEGTSTKEGVFGVADYRDLSGAEYILMRRDILDQLGLTQKAETMTSWTEFEEILTEVVANTDLAGIGNSDAAGTVISTFPYFLDSDSFAENRSFDNLGDSYQFICVDEKTDQVECYYFTEEYQKMIQRARDWYQKGLIYKDAANNQEMGDGMIKNNVFFSVAENGELGVEALKETAIGYELVCKKVADAQINTNSVVKFGFAVPVTATEPEAAVKFLNLLYTDADVVTTMAWGVEGRDWVRTEDGMADYPEGVTAETVLYHTADFLNGNQFITIPWAGSEPDLRQKQKESLENSTVSKYLGFSFDQTGYEQKITDCYNTGETYRKVLASGSVDYESTYAEFKAALEKSGIQDIIAAYQEQLDTWLETQE